MQVALIILSILACACASMSAYAIEDGTDYAFNRGKDASVTEYHKTSFQTGMYVFNILLAVGSVGGTAWLGYRLAHPVGSAQKDKVDGPTPNDD